MQTVLFRELDAAFWGAESASGSDLVWWCGRDRAAVRNATVHVFGELDRETEHEDGYDELQVVLARCWIESGAQNYLDEAAHSKASLDALHVDVSM